MYVCKTSNWCFYKKVMILLNHSQLDWPTKMSTITTKMIKEVINEMIDKAVENRIGDLENSEVC